MRLSKWGSVGLFVIIAACDCQAQPPKQPAIGDIFDSGSKGYPADGDVFESGGKGTPGDVYESGDCRNARNFRCCVEMHTIPTDSRTKVSGLPIYLKINGPLYNHNRCFLLSGSDCYPRFALCWGWKDPPKNDSKSDKTSDTPTNRDKQGPQRLDKQSPKRDDPTSKKAAKTTPNGDCNSPVKGPCNAQPGAKTSTPEELITAVYQFYRAQGFSKWGAAYMVGSLMWESNGLDPTARQPGGPGYGLAQWTDDSEHNSYPALICYAGIHGLCKDNFVVQLHFSVQQKPKVTKEFKNAKNAAEAKQAVMDFEDYGSEGADRYGNGATICKNVVCTKPSKSPFFDDPGVGVPAGTGLGDKVSKNIRCGTDLYQLIQAMKAPYKEPDGLGEAMKECLKAKRSGK